MNWEIHHVNLPAQDVIETRKFLTEIIGLNEGKWIYPETMGELHHDERSIAYFGIENRGIHAVRSIPSFAKDNGFMHNPTIGGHFAIGVSDLQGIMDRLTAAGIPFSDAGVYAMAGVHQIYVYDPSYNVIEINQTKSPLPADQLAKQDASEHVEIHHVMIPAHDVAQSVAFFRDIVGLEEGVAPDANDNGSAEKRDAAFFGEDGRGIHLVKPSATYPGSHGLLHNPTLDPHFSIQVENIDSIREKMDAADILYSNGGTCPTAASNSLLVYTPSLRLIELTQINI